MLSLIALLLISLIISLCWRPIANPVRQDGGGCRSCNHSRNYQSYRTINPLNQSRPNWTFTQEERKACQCEILPIYRNPGCHSTINKARVIARQALQLAKYKKTAQELEQRLERSCQLGKLTGQLQFPNPLSDSHEMPLDPTLPADQQPVTKGIHPDRVDISGLGAETVARFEARQAAIKELEE